jgi:hypothetical protein
VLIELRMILIRMAEINKDIDLLGFGGVDPLNHASEMAGGGGGGEIDIGPQLWRGGRDCVPVLSTRHKATAPCLRSIGLHSA